MRAIFLFLVTNLAVLVVLTIILQIFNVNNMGGLLILALIIGMGGSFISLAISKWLAKKNNESASDRTAN